MLLVHWKTPTWDWERVENNRKSSPNNSSTLMCSAMRSLCQKTTVYYWYSVRYPWCFTPYFALNICQEDSCSFLLFCKFHVWILHTVQVTESRKKSMYPLQGRRNGVGWGWGVGGGGVSLHRLQDFVLRPWSFVSDVSKFAALHPFHTSYFDTSQQEKQV